MLSAWCLAFSTSTAGSCWSYAAPIAWNVAMIATLVIFGNGRDLPALAVYLAWGSVAGSALQLARPAAAGVDAVGRRRFARADAPVREAVRNFGPVLASRGAVQLTRTSTR